MDPNQPANLVPPAKQPHLPISEAESHPEIYQDSPSGSKNTLLTLASLLVLTGIVGITLWLYIQNRQGSQKTQTAQLTSNNSTNPDITPITDNQRMESIKEKYDGVVCRRYTSIEEALREKEIACVLDLSGQNISTVPHAVSQLTNLAEINFSNNKITEFPEVLYILPKLISINLSNNRLTTNPEIKRLPILQSLDLSGNEISEKITIKKLPPLVIQY